MMRQDYSSQNTPILIHAALHPTKTAVPGPRRRLSFTISALTATRNLAPAASESSRRLLLEMAMVLPKTDVAKVRFGSKADSRPEPESGHSRFGATGS